MKKVITMILAVVAVESGFPSVTKHFTLDCRTGTREASADGEQLRYDADWVANGVTAKIYDGDVLLNSGTSGDYLWTPTTCGDHSLKLKIFGPSIYLLSTLSAMMTLPHVEVVTTAAKTETCTEDGCTKGSYCSRCNAVLSVPTVIPAGHQEVVTTAAKAATCTEAGCTKGSYCSRCDAVLSVSETLPALGHSGAVTQPAIEPTSSTAGRTDEIRCSRCNALLQAATVISALGYIRNVTARQLWPHRKIEVCYEIAEDIGEAVSANTLLALSCNAGGTGTTSTTPSISNTSSYKWTKSGTTWTSGGKGVNNLSTSYITCSVTGPGTISFKWKVSSESGYDKLHFYVDGNEPYTAISGTIDWQTKSYSLVSGSHTLKWSYTKDSSTHSGSDCGWVDAITLTTTGPSGSMASTVIGDRSAEPGLHRVVWDMEQDGISVNASDLEFTTAYGSKNGTATNVMANTSSSVNNGMSVSGSVNLGYSPIDQEIAEILIDGEKMLSSTKSGSFVWQPRTKGTHTLKHVAGGNEWTRTVNVTGLAFAEPPAPNPPTAEDPNISIGSVSASVAAAGGTKSITTSGSGTWTATTSADWLTFQGNSSKTAGQSCIVKAAANTGVEERTGYVYVSGHVFTIMQAGVGAELQTYSAEFGADGGSGSFTVLGEPGSSWQTKSNVDWISLENVSGEGEAEVRFVVAPWHVVSTRSGTITAAGCTFTVNQTGRLMKLDKNSGSYDYHSHAIDVQVNALSGVEWNVFPYNGWISAVDGGNGAGGDNVALAVNENPSYAARTGKVQIGSEMLVVEQEGRPTAALEFTISPENSTGSVNGANGLIAVTATPDLPWSAASTVNWLTVAPAMREGAGNGNVVYTVSPNSTMTSRSGGIAVTPASGSGLSAKTHTVTQPAATAMISSEGHTFSAAGESYSVDVTIADVVNWTISKSDSWISIDGSMNRLGPGAVVISAAANNTVDVREGTVTIAGHAFSVRQLGRTVEVEYTAKVFDAYGGDGTIDVHPNGTVNWTAISSATWLTIWAEDGANDNPDGSVSGSGDGTIGYYVDPYVGDGEMLTGWITIGDKTVYITQRAYELSIDPCATNVTGNAGAGEVCVPASIGEVWNAIATEPWITVVSGYDEGTGSGTVRFTYTENDTGVQRTGRIVIAGEEYTITQAARQLVTVDARVEITGGGGSGCSVSGAGRYDLGSQVALTAVAQDGYEFLNWILPNSATSTANPLLVTADVDKEIIASFRRIPEYMVNGEIVREGTVRNFSAPAAVVDGGTKLVCLGTSAYPEKGTSFSLVVSQDVAFEWDLWQTNYLLTVSAEGPGTVLVGGETPTLPMWVADGEVVELAATPDADKTFFRWTGDVETAVAGRATLPLTMDGPKTITANFGVWNDTLATALDAPTMTFVTGGDAVWTPVVDATAQTGVSSVRSGDIAANSETWMETSVLGPAGLRFRWRVDCERDDGGEATWDHLTVFVNGHEYCRLDGNTDWQEVYIHIQDLAGEESTVRWSFYRDDYEESSDDCRHCGWVDDVRWTPYY